MITKARDSSAETAQAKNTEPATLHLPAGYDLDSAGVRAICWCGWRGPARAGRAAAAGALRQEHRFTPPVCGSCGRTGGRRGLAYASPYACLDMVFDRGSEYFSCRDQDTCRSWSPQQSRPHGASVATDN
jgi:hypothetical protein